MNFFVIILLWQHTMYLCTLFLVQGYSIIFPENHALYETCGKRDRTRQATDNNMHKLFAGLIRRTTCARAQFSGCSSTTNAHSETGQMAVCCQRLPLGALSSRSAPFVLVGALFKKIGLFLNTWRFRKMR